MSNNETIKLKLQSKLQKWNNIKLQIIINSISNYQANRFASIIFTIKHTEFYSHIAKVRISAVIAVSLFLVILQSFVSPILIFFKTESNLNISLENFCCGIICYLALFSFRKINRVNSYILVNCKIILGRLKKL